MFTPDEKILFDKAVFHADEGWQAEDKVCNDDDPVNTPEALSLAYINAQINRDAVIDQLLTLLHARGQNSYTVDSVYVMVKETSESNRNSAIVNSLFADLNDDDLMQDGITAREARKQVRRDLDNNYRDRI